MPEKKLQHYVPKCHLRPFCLDPEQAAINLFNIARVKLIKDAPIKGQCARNYFYGKDRLLENALQEPEGAYAAIVAKATNDSDCITPSDLAVLREFALLQTFRSYGYIEKLMAISDQQYADMEAAASGNRVPPRMLANLDEAVVMAIRQFMETRDHVRDLDACLIVNETRRQFITSDDPAIHTNRFHFQKLANDAFGLGSAGAMFILPLTPKLAFFAFDGNVYFVPDRRGNTVTIRRDDEVSALNELQLLHARHNLYYSDDATGRILLSEFTKCALERPTVWSKITYFEKSGESEKLEHFEQVEVMTLGPGREFLTALQQVHVRPSRWARLFRYRLHPRYVDTGTGAGCIRPSSELFKEMVKRGNGKTKRIIASRTR